MFLLDGNPINIDIPFTDANGTQYPANWIRLASSEERAAIGITEVADEPIYDQRFYWGVGNPKDLDSLKTQWVAQVKDTAGKMLAQTDWMVIRKAERNVDIPQETVDFRADVVTECDRLETAINACKTVKELIEIVSAQNWPLVDRN